MTNDRSCWQILRLTTTGFLLLLGLGLGACSPLTPPAPDAPSPAPSETTAEPMDESPQPAPSPQREAQQLPITAHLYLENRPEPILLEVARTPRQQAIGLMYRERESLPDNQGMLFPFATARRAQFWMKNVKFSLDMLFIYEGKVVAIAANVPPCVLEPCPVYGPDMPVDGVIELAGERAADLNIEVGDAIRIEFLKGDAQPNQ